MDGLRLDALDADDLSILSAYSQDAVLKLSDCRYLGREKRFVIEMNRFVWEKAMRGGRFSLFRKRDYERRRAILDFGRVMRVQRQGLDLARGDAVLDLLAIRFAPAEPPAGTIELVFAGGSALRLDVECVEARLTDEEAAWSTTALPDHDRPDA